LTPLLELDGLTKNFATREVVNNLSLQINGGDVVALLGLNGAGKTTSLRMAAGYLTPTSGTARVCGHDVEKNANAARRCFGYVPEGAPLYGELTVTQFLKFIASARGLKSAAMTTACATSLNRLRLESVQHQVIDTLSKGYRRRVALAQALLHAPQLLILDEPTDGLDPQQKNAVRSLLRDVGTDKAVLISTHILEEVEALCSRVIVIHRGKIVLDTTPEAMRKQSAFAHAVTLTFAPNTSLAALDKQWTHSLFTLPDGRVQATFQSVTGGPILAPVLHATQVAHLMPLDFIVETGRLDDVFARLTA
jgi:ABC-2 type transport system ATP-binding protein